MAMLSMPRTHRRAATARQAQPADHPVVCRRQPALGSAVERRDAARVPPNDDACGRPRNVDDARV